MKFLIVGLGNIGEEYANTRHNVGFKILDALAGASNASFSDKRYGSVAGFKYKARTFVLLKPSTYVNRSGLAVNFWLKKEKVPLENLLIITDDIALPFGKLRLRPKGGDAGHNGLKSVQEVLGTTNYPRLRFGIGREFSYGQQIDYVLGEWSDEELGILYERIPIVIETIKSFATIGISHTMNIYNNR